MCGRYSVLTEDEIVEIREIIREWSMRIVKDDFHDYAPAPGEVRPTDYAPVITGGDGGEISFESLRWGFRKFGGKGVIINARSETLTAKGMFNSLLVVGRCVVPAGEYYEWERAGAGKRSGKVVKHFVKDANGNLLFMAGLYRNSSGEPGSPGYKDSPGEREFVIITKPAYGDVEKIHDRMPVILKASQIEPWLGGKLTPDDITRLDFNAEVTPVGEAAAAPDDGAEQLALDL